MNLELLEEICRTPGAPGFEDRIREVVVRELEPLVDDVRVDTMGNVIAHRKGKPGSKKLMIAAHMDEIGFVVRHVDDSGYVRFGTLGGFDPKTLTAQRVLVHTRSGDLLGVLGSKPIHLMTDEERKQSPKIEHYFIDLGLPADQVKEKVRLGDPVTRERAFVEIGETVNTKSLDDRVGVFVMIEAVRAASKHAVDLYAVVTVQEELGLRGATTAANAIEPDIGIAVDVTLANDGPDAKAYDRVTELGKGTAIKILDASFVANHRLVDFMVSLAESQEIPHQLEVLTRGGTDSAALQRAGAGAIAGCVSVPCRYAHTVVEMCHRDDIQASIDLLGATISGIHKADLGW
jgi:endoglucanase